MLKTRGSVLSVVGNPTHTSAQSGPQSETSIWNEGIVPGSNSNASITAVQAIIGVSREADFILVHRGAANELGGDLEVDSLLLVR